MWNIARWVASGSAVVLVCSILPQTGCQESREVDTEAVLEEAVDLVTAGRYAEGLEKMRALVESSPDDLRIQRYYGEALLAAGQPSLAVWPLSRAMRDADQRVEAGLLLAGAQLKSGSGIDAIKTATSVLEVEPKNEAVLILRARAHLNENLEERAIEDIDRAEALGADQTTLDLLRLDALLGLGKEKEAEALLGEMAEQAEQMREDDPANAARLCAATATFTGERGQIDEAKKRFEKCLEGDGILHVSLVQLAVEFFDAHGEPARSTELYKRRFEVDPDRLEARVEYADRLQKVGRMNEGEAILLEATGKQKAAWAALADLYAIAGNVQKALEALDKAIEASPAKREAWLFSRADFLLALGKLDEAEKALEDIDVPAHRALLLARIAAARGRLEAAVEHFEEGIRLWPDNPDARYLAALTYERMGRWTEAAAHLREAARMDPPHYASSIELAELQHALGDSEGVSFLLMRLADENPRDPKVIERVIEYAAETNSAELGTNMLAMLARLPGQAGRAVTIAADRMERTEGAAAALDMVDRAGLDLIDPQNVEALETRTRLLVELDRHDEALTTIATALEKEDRSARLRVLRASVFRDRDQNDRAMRELEEARKADPTHLAAVLALAALHAEAGNLDVARTLYAEAIPIEASQTKADAPGGESLAALELARLELRAGDVESARARLKEILTEHPRQGNAAWLLIEAYGEKDGSSGLDDATHRDLALRASVFEGSPEARSYWQTLKASQS